MSCHRCGVLEHERDAHLAKLREVSARLARTDEVCHALRVELEARKRQDAKLLEAAKAKVATFDPQQLDLVDWIEVNP